MAGDRVLILSLDGGTWNVLGPLAERGVMPFVRRMMSEGLRAELRSTIPPVTAPAWLSYLTAVQPSRHCTYDFQAFDRETRRLEFLPDTCDLPTGWDHLDALGESYCCVGVPMTYPPGERRHGVIVCGIDAPSVDAAFGSREIRRLAAPDYELVPRLQSREGDVSFADHAAQSEENRETLTTTLAERYAWRILHHHVQSTDVVQHRLWHELDRCVRAGEGFLDEFYRRVDGVLQRIHEKCRPRFCVLMSDHGFRPVRKVISLNRWLLERGYLRWVRRFRLGGGLLSLARRLDVFDLRRLVLPNKRLWTRFLVGAHFGYFDLDRSVAFVANGTTFGHLFLCPDAPQDRCTELLSELEELKDPGDGRKVIGRIMSHRDAFGAPPGRYGPDYFLVPAEGCQFCDAALFRHWVRPVAPGDVRFGTGGHALEGIFCVAGHGRARLTRAPHVVDVFPTALRLAALPGMEGADGRPCVELEGEPGPAGSEGTPEARHARGSSTYSAEDKRRIAGRLKGLGYF